LDLHKRASASSGVAAALIADAISFTIDTGLGFYYSLFTGPRRPAEKDPTMNTLDTALSVAVMIYRVSSESRARELLAKLNRELCSNVVSYYPDGGAFQIYALRQFRAPVPDGEREALRLELAQEVLADFAHALMA
jgi:hypothetical protein